MPTEREHRGGFGILNEKTAGTIARPGGCTFRASGIGQTTTLTSLPFTTMTLRTALPSVHL